MNRPRSVSPFAWLVLAAGCLGAVWLLSGVGCAPTSTRGRSGPGTAGGEQGDAQTGQILFDTVAENLQTLERFVNTRVDQPINVLGAGNTTDGQPAKAIIHKRNSNDPAAQFDQLSVVARNSQFLKNGIQAGDIVRFFALRDEFGSEKYVELPVAEVLNDYTLRLGVVLPQPIYSPEKIEIWRKYSGELMRVADRLNYWAQSGEPKFFWEPSPDENVLVQIINRLNQWARSLKGDDTWQRDPLLEGLPAELAELPQVKALGGLTFEPEDGRILQEAVWLRDIAAREQGADLDDLARTQKLFDWVVRNIQLETRASQQGLFNRPWQTLLYGRGTAEERAWLLVLLGRQQGLDLAVVQPAAGGEGAAAAPLLIGLSHSGKLHLFDPALGLPLPGPAGQGVATLDQLAADDALLRQLDLDAEHPYPLKAEQLAKAKILLEGSPSYLSRRMKLVEAKLAGKQRVVLAAEPSAQAARVKKAAGVQEVGLWTYPLETLVRQSNMTRDERVAAVRQFYVFPTEPILWKGRVLHFKGIYETEDHDGAKAFYLQSRPANTAISNSGLLPSQQDVIGIGKQDASYWLGLIVFEEAARGGKDDAARKNYEVALDYFQKRVLEQYPDGIWTSGARYNLGRTYEALGQNAEARAAYEADQGPQRHGNLLRARGLK